MSASHVVIFVLSPVLGLLDVVCLSVLAGFLSVSVADGFLLSSIVGFCVSFPLTVTVIVFVEEAPLLSVTLYITVYVPAFEVLQLSL